MNQKMAISVLFVVLVCFSCTPPAPVEETQPLPPTTLELLNQSLSPGINLGNALDAPAEGEWGVVIKDEYFEIIKDAGFNSVRVPVRWSAHTDTLAPFTIDSVFMARVHYVIDMALKHDLTVVVNTHHYNSLFNAPAEHLERLLAIWHQIGQSFATYPAQLVFEPLNEPHAKLTPALWNEWIPILTKELRSTNPDRTLMFGTANWGGISKLDSLVIPETEHNVIVTVHYYDPYHFTHQGASWSEGSDEWLGLTWAAEGEQLAQMGKDFDKIKAYSVKNNRPIYMGEFGAFSTVDTTSRVAWTSQVVQESEKRGFSWAYWEFCSGFGVYDSESDTYRDFLLKALIQDK